MDHHAALVRNRLDMLWSHIGQQQPELAIGRFARIHPEAKLYAPFWIGDGAYIDKGVEIGPYSVVGNQAYINEYATLHETMIEDGSYLGPHTQMSNHLILEGILFNRIEKIKHDRIDPEIYRPLLLTA